MHVYNYSWSTVLFIILINNRNNSLTYVLSVKHKWYFWNSKFSTIFKTLDQFRERLQARYESGRVPNNINPRNRIFRHVKGEQYATAIYGTDLT